MKHCFVCGSEFALNTSLETLDRGNRLAMDPDRGRLWVICEECRTWNLVPLEARWETIEELEKLARDRGRVLATTENVALLEDGPLTIVRIGSTRRKEEAWWRYLQEAENRARNARKIVRRGKWKDAVVSTILIGLPLPGFTPDEKWIERARAASFGKHLWYGDASCSKCGAARHKLSFDDAFLVSAHSSILQLRANCKSCGGSGYFDLTGPRVTRVIERALAYSNYAGGGWVQLNAAAHLLDEQTNAAQFIASVAAQPLDIQRLPKVHMLALEMAVNEARERELLQLEVRELAERWAYEEELARIVDRELTP